MLMSTTRGALIRLGSAIVAGALVLGAGCGSESGNDSADQPAAPQRGEPDGVYAVRGVIEHLPEGAMDLMIHHETIEDFTDREGKVVGMDAMTMPFPELAEGVSLDGFGVGDKVAIVFEVWWSPPQGWALASIEKLADDTELDFGGPAADDAGAFAVRGEIVTLPGADDAERRMMIRHEAMDGFTNSAGEVVGMRSMTMPFVVGEGVDLDGLAAGDVVSMQVRVDRADNRMKLIITAITRLPEGTELDFTRLPNTGG